MPDKSSLAFRTNIYLVSRKVSIANDKVFLSKITDPAALDVLWHYNGSHGDLLTRNQAIIHNVARHCTYAEKGCYPWGTLIGSSDVVCLCEKRDCKLYSECSQYHPSKLNAHKLRTAEEGGSLWRERKAWEEKLLDSFYDLYGPGWSQWKKLIPWMDFDAVQNAARDYGYEVWSDKERQDFLENEGYNWTLRELKALQSAYPAFESSSPKWKKLLPGRTPQERQELAELLGVPSKEELSRLIAKAQELR